MSERDEMLVVFKSMFKLFEWIYDANSIIPMQYFEGKYCCKVVF